MPSNYYTIRNIFRRLSLLEKDPWRDITSVRQRLTGAVKVVEQLSRRRSS